MNRKNKSEYCFKKYPYKDKFLRNLRDDGFNGYGAIRLNKNVSLVMHGGYYRSFGYGEWIENRINEDIEKRKIARDELLKYEEERLDMAYYLTEMGTDYAIFL